MFATRGQTYNLTHVGDLGWIMGATEAEDARRAGQRLAVVRVESKEGEERSILEVVVG